MKRHYSVLILRISENLKYYSYIILDLKILDKA